MRGPDAELDDHRKASLLGGFTQELFGKRLAHRHGRVGPRSESAKASKFRLLSDDPDIHHCQFPKGSESCQAICHHQYYVAVEEQAKTGVLGEVASSLLKRGSTRKHMLCRARAGPSRYTKSAKNLSPLVREWNARRRNVDSSFNLSVIDELMMIADYIV